ncbi:MAG: SDR family oxidoreductase [Bdellovibrionales bacterium]|nr:SDR family oxidoreductase [Bdellovibrionales bacterium]
MWALQVTYLTPARILHHFLSKPGSVKQMVFVGSAIADSSADPMASSYSSAKHGLKGLIDSINAEDPDIDVRIFRPGYIDTAMLPPQASPRKEGLPLLSPEEAAKRFVQWVQDPNGRKSFLLEAQG